MALQVAVFNNDVRLEGVSISDKPSMIIGEPVGQSSIVISQEWYGEKLSPTKEEIVDRLAREGFKLVADSYFGWYRPEDGVVLVDAKPDNFVKLPEGIVPIDLQIALFTPEQLQEAGLS